MQSAKTVNNVQIASRLGEIADLLQKQNANPFRVNAYRHASATVKGLDRAVTDIINKEGTTGLIDLPGVGQGIARSIVEYVATGHMSRLESLRAGNDPVALFQKIPGIGSKLSHRIIETLHLDSLEALEIAAHNGRLLSVSGFSENKVNMVKAWLAQTLGRSRHSQPDTAEIKEPPVELLLSIDQKYRDKATKGKLPKIAPKRFNPEAKAWLPIMHKSKNDWHFTALYSNTARAHQLHRTDDWVIIYFYDEQHHEGQYTVVTETKGPLVGERVVRGREQECLALHAERHA
ncbi:MAG: helix-hairpin-helix domain-containing protein [Gammaproteobacteria bacterium]|jgi:DNA uptake protein ComE-like DNA-binding protein